MAIIIRIIKIRHWLVIRLVIRVKILVVTVWLVLLINIEQMFCLGVIVKKDIMIVKIRVNVQVYKKKKKLIKFK